MYPTVSINDWYNVFQILEKQYIHCLLFCFVSSFRDNFQTCLVTVTYILNISTMGIVAYSQQASQSVCVQLVYNFAGRFSLCFHRGLHFEHIYNGYSRICWYLQEASQLVCVKLYTNFTQTNWLALQGVFLCVFLLHCEKWQSVSGYAEHYLCNL